MILKYHGGGGGGGFSLYTLDILVKKNLIKNSTKKKKIKIYVVRRYIKPGL